MKPRITAISFALLISSLSLSAQDVPAAPLPAALATARALFIGNAGDQENADCLRAYNDFYDGIASLKRFQQVSDPNQADLVLEMHYEINLGEAKVTNDAHSLRQFRVVLIDPRSHVILWTLVERTNYALRQSNRNKNLDDTVTALVHDFDLLVSPAPLPPNNKSRVTH
jgi:hypothetical protein